jgi:hypothetical protein
MAHTIKDVGYVNRTPQILPNFGAIIIIHKILYKQSESNIITIGAKVLPVPLMEPARE